MHGDASNEPTKQDNKYQVNEKYQYNHLMIFSENLGNNFEAMLYNTSKELCNRWFHEKCEAFHVTANFVHNNNNFLASSLQN